MSQSATGSPVEPGPTGAAGPAVAGPPVRDAQFAHLSLEGLRTYRRTLSTEENRVSYWRRIVQARLDVVRAVDTGGVPSVAALSHVFAESRPMAARTARMEVSPSDDLPPLPDLLAVWSREPRPGDPVHNAALSHDLTKAEAQLSAYRLALHRRLTAATTELIARYREQPTLCLSALPERKPMLGVRTG
jgi:hypothetical protein